MERTDRERAAADGCAGPGEDGVETDGAEEGAFAGHVGAADDEQRRAFVKLGIVGDGLGGGQQRVGDGLAAEAFAVGKEFRRDGGGVFEGEGREREQGFDAAEGGDPEVSFLAVARAPGFEGERDLGGPKEHEGDEAEELVAGGIEQFYQALEVASGAGGAGEAIAGFGEQGRSEGFFLDDGGEFSEQLQVARGLLQAGGDLLDAGLEQCAEDEGDAGEDEQVEDREEAEEPAGEGE